MTYDADDARARCEAALRFYADLQSYANGDAAPVLDDSGFTARAVLYKRRDEPAPERFEDEPVPPAVLEELDRRLAALPDDNEPTPDWREQILAAGSGAAVDVVHDPQAIRAALEDTVEEPR